MGTFHIHKQQCSYDITSQIIDHSFKHSYKIRKHGIRKGHNAQTCYVSLFEDDTTKIKMGAQNIAKENKTVPRKVATTHTEDGHK